MIERGIARIARDRSGRASPRQSTPAATSARRSRYGCRCSRRRCARPRAGARQPRLAGIAPPTSPATRIARARPRRAPPRSPRKIARSRSAFPSSFRHAMTSAHDRRNARTRSPARRRRADWTIPQDWAHYTRRGTRDLGHAVRAPGEAAARPRVERLSARARRAQAVEARHPRFRGTVRAADEADRLAGRRGARAGARRRVLRPHGQSPLRRGQFHPPPRPARLSAGARRLPRRVRPCADARRSGVRRLSRRPMARAASARWSSDALKYLGAALLVHGRVRPDRRARGPAHLWLGHRLELRRKPLRARRSQPQPHRLRPRRG